MNLALQTFELAYIQLQFNKQKQALAEVYARITQGLVYELLRTGDETTFKAQFPKTYPYLKKGIADIKNWKHNDHWGDTKHLYQATRRRDTANAAKVNLRRLSGKEAWGLDDTKSHAALCGCIKSAIDKEHYSQLINYTTEYGIQCLICLRIDKKGNTALMYALMQQQWEVAKFLLKNYSLAIISAINNSQNTALHVATLKSAPPDIYEWILNLNPYHNDVANREGHTPRDLVLIKNALSQQPNKKTIVQCLGSGAKPDVTIDGVSLLEILIKKNKLVAIKTILVFFQNTPQALRFYRDVNFQVTLCRAAKKYNRPKIFAALLKAIIHHNFRNCLKNAIVNNNKEKVEKLCENSELPLSAIEFTDEDKAKFNPDLFQLFCLKKNQAVRLDNLFYQTNKEIESSRNPEEWRSELNKHTFQNLIVDQEQGAHIIHFAATTNNWTLLNILFETNGSQKADVFDVDGQTPLLVAAGEGHYDFCLNLLSKGADPRVIDNEGLALEDLLATEDHEDEEDLEKKKQILMLKQKKESDAEAGDRIPNYYKALKDYIPEEIQSLIYDAPRNVSGKWSQSSPPFFTEERTAATADASSFIGGKWVPGMRQ